MAKSREKAAKSFLYIIVKIQIDKRQLRSLRCQNNAKKFGRILEKCTKYQWEEYGKQTALFTIFSYLELWKSKEDWSTNAKTNNEKMFLKASFQNLLRYSVISFWVFGAVVIISPLQLSSRKLIDMVFFQERPRLLVSPRWCIFIFCSAVLHAVPMLMSNTINLSLTVDIRCLQVLRNSDQLNFDFF